MSVSREEILTKVEETVLGIPGVEAMRFLDPGLREEVTRIELTAERNGACGGLVPFRNEGVWATLSREVCLIIVGNAHFTVENDVLLTLIDTSGKVIAEYVPERIRERFVRDHPDARFLSDDFVLHSDFSVSGEPYFLIDEVAFPPLEGVEGITRITSGSVSTLADDWVRAQMGCERSDHWSHLVGFDILS